MASKTACTFTGPRPMRFSFGYDEEDEHCLYLKFIMEQQIIKLIESGVSLFYSGMALGVDQWAAKIVLDMKRQYSHVRLVAVLPCETQANKWSPEQREQYFSTLPICDDVVTLRGRFTQGCIQERNRYMVDRAGFLLAVYDGTPKGGTAYNVRYARERKLEIITIHPDTFAVVSEVDAEAMERRKHIRILPYESENH